MGKNDHARLPSVNKTMFDKGNWQAFTAVVKYIDLFDKANCPAFLAVQKPRCRSNGASCCNNSADARGSNHPPVYCECAEGYEDRRKYVYRLHRHLYGMKDSPRGWGKLFSSVYTDFGLTVVHEHVGSKPKRMSVPKDLSTGIYPSNMTVIP